MPSEGFVPRVSAEKLRAAEEQLAEASMIGHQNMMSSAREEYMGKIEKYLKDNSLSFEDLSRIKLRTEGGNIKGVIKSKEKKGEDHLIDMEIGVYRSDAGDDVAVVEKALIDGKNVELAFAQKVLDKYFGIAITMQRMENNDSELIPAVEQQMREGAEEKRREFEETIAADLL